MLNWVRRADRALAGKPEHWLRVALLVTAGVLVLIALFGTPTLMAGVLAYEWLP